MDANELWLGRGETGSGEPTKPTTPTVASSVSVVSAWSLVPQSSEGTLVHSLPWAAVEVRSVVAVRCSDGSQRRGREATASRVGQGHLLYTSVRYQDGEDAARLARSIGGESWYPTPEALTTPTEVMVANVVGNVSGRTRAKQRLASPASGVGDGQIP